MKKLLSVALATTLVMSCCSPFVRAQEVAATSSATQEQDFSYQSSPTSENLERVIKIVRPLIDVPEDYTEFSWDFNTASIYKSASWRFSWENGEKGRIVVYCDNDGNIYNYRNSSYSDSSYSLPSHSPESLEEVARSFISKVAPYTENSTLNLSQTPTGNIYSSSYTYEFVRYENDIPVPDETLSVTVNYTDGSVTRFYSDYTIGITFENNEKIITEDEAKDILSQNQQMSLSYRLKNEYDDDGNLVSRKAYLVYTPTLSYISVDAVTGEVYTERNTWDIIDSDTSNKYFDSVSGSGAFTEDAEKESSADYGSSYQLSDEELKALGTLEGLISKQSAIDTVIKNPLLYIDEKATAVSANLRKVESEILPLADEAKAEKEAKQEYVWDLYFTSAYEEECFYREMSATVDARTGELLSYHCSLPGYNYYKKTNSEIPTVTLDEEEAIKKAEEFLKATVPDKCESLSYQSSYNAYSPIYYTEDENGESCPVYGAKAFRFVRTNENVDFDANSARVGVDFESGKVTSYSLNWYYGVEFESTKDIITPKEALTALYTDNGFGLNYEINTLFTYNEYLLNQNDGKIFDYDELYEKMLTSRAVYSAYNSGTTVIGAINGEKLNYSGEKYEQRDERKVYTDIDSHWSKQTAERFSWVGIGTDSEKFAPNEEISAKEFYDLCEYFSLESYDQRKDESSCISRMDAVKYLVDCLGYSKIARLENIFATDFKDNSDFSKEDIGYVAIARGLGIIKGNGSSFDSSSLLTRAQCYTLVENVLSSDIYR